MKAALLLALLPLTVSAQVDNITITGNAYQGDQTQTFTASFSVDTQTATETFEDAGAGSFWEAFRGNVTNLTAAIGGVPQDMGSNLFGMGMLFVNPQQILTGDISAGNLRLDYEGFPVSSNDLNGIIRSGTPYGGALNGWAVGGSLTVTSVGIPEPPTWALFIVPFALIALGFLKGYRYGT